MNPKRDEKGTTLLEILVALALMSLVLTGMFSVYWAGSRAYTRQSASSDAQYCSRTAMQWMIRDIISSKPFNGSPALNSDSLTLHIPMAGGEEAQEVSYYLSSTNLRRDNLAVMDNICYLNFVRDSGSELIKITVEARVNEQSCRLTSTARPRVSPADN